jgi:hypothetical protein
MRALRIIIFPEHQSGAVTAEGERVGEHNFHFLVTGSPWHIIEIAILIPLLMVESRWNKLI